MKAYHICYHTDEDGLAAAAVIYEYLKKVNKTGKKKIRYFFYKIDYTVDLRTVISSGIPSGDEIYFVDYSFRRYGAPSKGVLRVQVTVVCNGPNPAFKELTF